VAAVAVSPATAADFDFEPDPEAKNRTTFIVLGALLGPVVRTIFMQGTKARALRNFVSRYSRSGSPAR